MVFSIYRDRDDGWDRTLLSAGIRGLIWALFQVPMRSDGPYLFRRELFDPKVLVPDTFFLNFEFPIRVLRQRVPHAVVAIRACPDVRDKARAPACGASPGWPGTWFRCDCACRWVLWSIAGR